MGIDSSGHRYCDGCFATMEVANRLWLNKAYCSVCYARHFVIVDCSRCRAHTSVYRNSHGPFLCDRCRLEPRLCLRCGRPVDQAGLVIDDRVVCPSCTPYMKAWPDCPQCHRPARELWAKPELGIDVPICVRCHQRRDHKTCAVCRRYRPVAGHLPGGKPHCADCHPDHPLTHACPDCSALTPGSGNARCPICTIIHRMRRTSDVLAMSLHANWSRQWLVGFADWLLARERPHPHSTLRFRRHLGFFQRLDATYAGPQEVTPASLLRLWSIAELRRMLLPMQYLAEQHGILIAAEEKLAAAERHRIAAMRTNAQETPWDPLVRAYTDMLASSQLNPRTQRQYVHAAVTFCAAVGATTEQPWTDEAMTQYLEQQPSTYTNLCRFVRFVREIRSWPVTMPAKPHIERTVPTSVQVFRRLLRRVPDGEPDRAPVLLLQRILSRAFSIRVADLSMPDIQYTQDGNTASLIHPTHGTIGVPREFMSIAQSWSSRRRVRRPQHPSPSPGTRHGDVAVR